MVIVNVFKKNSEPVSRVLYSFAGMLAIYLRTTSPLSSIVLPSGSSGPPSLFVDLRQQSFAGLHELSTPGVHSIDITADLVSSYLTFSPLPHGRGGLSLLHLLTLADLFLLGSGMPCVARTFLSFSAAASRFTVCSRVQSYETFLKAHKVSGII